MINAMTEDQIDFELEQMVNPITADRRKVMADAQRPVVAKLAVNTRHEGMKQFGAVAGRFCIGLVFLGAISRAWIDPVFGLTVAGSCFVWACAKFLRRRR